MQVTPSMRSDLLTKVKRELAYMLHPVSENKLRDVSVRAVDTVLDSLPEPDAVHHQKRVTELEAELNRLNSAVFSDYLGDG